MESQQAMRFNRVGIHDPAVDNIEGASLLVPEGWTLAGGFVWMPLFAIQANLLVRLDDPSTGASVFTLPLQQFAWTMQQTFLPPGSNWLGSVLLPPPRDAVEFVRTFLLQGALQHLAGARIVHAEDLPNLAAEISRSVGGQRTARVTRLRHAYEWGGRMWEEDVYITLVYSQPSAVTMWWCDGYAMRAPAGELDRMRPVLSVPVQSLRYSLDWEATRDHVRNLFRQNARDEVIRTGRMGELLRQHRQQLRQMHQQVWQERQVAQDRQNFVFRETLGGIETYRNPFDSRTVELPLGYQNQWVSRDGKVLLTNDSMLNPAHGSTEEWVRMERYGPR